LEQEKLPVASITNPQLAIATDPVQNKALITVSCDVEFTAFEVNAMTQLGLSYSLECDLLNMEMAYPQSVVNFVGQEFPRIPGQGQSHDHATFEAITAMNALHMYIFGRDTLVAELTLKNEESGATTVKRTPSVSVNLAA
jgi:hypothetical protein